MRLGILREVATLPPAPVQRRLLDQTGCHVVLEEGAPTRESQRNLQRLLLSLRNGDEVVVFNLDSFQATTGQLAEMIRKLFETGVVLRFLQGPDLLAPPPSTPKVLVLLAEHEARRPSRPPSRMRSRAHLPQLSRYQIEYARRLLKEGQPLRSVGLIFQVTPAELSELLEL